MMRVLFALIALLMAVHSGLAMYCNNQPLDYHDPWGEAPIPMGVTAEDVGRANMIGNMMTSGIPYQQAWQATTPRDSMMEKNFQDGLQLYVAMGTMAMPAAAPARILGVAILDEALMGSGIASLTQLQANAFARRPLMAGVPETAAGGFLLGGAGSALVRGGAVVPSLLRSSSRAEFPMIPGMPLGYAGGPGAMWAGEVGAAAKAATPTGEFYSAAFQMRLGSTSYPGLTRYMHFKEANAALDAAMETNPALAKLGISVPKSPTGSILGKSPENWVWHHNTEAGVMQLVPKSQHPNIPGGIFWGTMHPEGDGGFSIWGK